MATSQLRKKVNSLAIYRIHYLKVYDETWTVGSSNVAVAQTGLFVVLASILEWISSEMAFKLDMICESLNVQLPTGKEMWFSFV